MQLVGVPAQGSGKRLTDIPGRGSSCDAATLPYGDRGRSRFWRDAGRRLLLGRGPQMCSPSPVQPRAPTPPETPAFAVALPLFLVVAKLCRLLRP